MARLSVGAWDIAGLCDVPAITSAINAHLRRHDAYRSWFERQAPGRILRRTSPIPGRETPSPICASWPRALAEFNPVGAID
jgi:hypothetical protein